MGISSPPLTTQYEFGQWEWPYFSTFTNGLWWDTDPGVIESSWGVTHGHPLYTIASGDGVGYSSGNWFSYKLHFAGVGPRGYWGAGEQIGFSVGLFKNGVYQNGGTRVYGNNSDGSLLSTHTWIDEQEFNSIPLPVPEPATMTLVGLGLVGIGALRRRMRKS